MCWLPNLLTSTFDLFVTFIPFWTWLLFLSKIKLCLCSKSLPQLWPSASVFAKNSEPNFISIAFSALATSVSPSHQWWSKGTLDSGCPCLLPSVYAPGPPSKAGRFTWSFNLGIEQKYRRLCYCLKCIGSLGIQNSAPCHMVFPLCDERIWLENNQFSKKKKSQTLSKWEQMEFVFYLNNTFTFKKKRLFKENLLSKTLPQIASNPWMVEIHLMLILWVQVPPDS